MDKIFQPTINKFKTTLSEVEVVVLKQVDTVRVKSRLEENFETVNSPVSMNLQFFILEENLENDRGVCLSVSFQNHEPIVDGLHFRKANELFAYADLSYAEGERISNFGIVRLRTDAADYAQQLADVGESLSLYFRSQISVIVDRLNENVKQGA